MSLLPSVSIIVPFFRVEAYIERSARSVLEQTYPNCEFIFIDDCSPDNSVAVLERVFDDYPNQKNRIRLYRHTSNCGIASSRNHALRVCNGSFITWVDGDDYLEKNAVLRMVKCQQQNDSDIVSGSVFEHTDNGILEYSLFPNEPKQQIICGLLDFSLKKNVWGRLIRTSLYTDNHIQCIDGVNYHEDFQVLPRLVYYANTLSVLNEPVYHYDRSNARSYISSARSDITTKLIKDQQDLASVKLLRDFFTDKNPHFSFLSNEAVVYYLRELLRDTTRTNNKSLFLSTARELASLDYRYVYRTAKNLWKMARINPSLCWIIKRIRYYLLEHK